jgi:hypothetical protein
MCGFEPDFQAITKHGVPTKLINIIKETYRGDTAQIRTELLSDIIKIQKGVRQGDTLSPVLFTAAVEEIFKRTNQSSGVNGRKLNTLSEYTCFQFRGPPPGVSAK